MHEGAFDVVKDTFQQLSMSERGRKHMLTHLFTKITILSVVGLNILEIQQEHDKNVN